MKGYYTYIIFSLSILIPTIAGIIRSNSTLKSYYPFLIFIWLGTLNEILSIVLALTVRSNTISSNIYVLLEYVILLFQFYKWNNGSIRKLMVLILLGFLVWIVDNVILHTITDSNSLF